MAEKEDVIITRHGVPAGILIGFEDPEAWWEELLLRDPRFRARVAQARGSLRESHPAQYSAPVRPEVWQYRVGGYQVCEKWLKDRRDRRLELEDVRTYWRIVTALKRTIELQQEIDALYPGVEAETISG